MRISAFFFLLAFAFIAMPSAASAADFAYGTLSLPNDTQGVVRMRTLETYTDYLCDLAGPACVNAGTSTPSFMPAVFAGRNAILSPDGRAAIARDGVSYFYNLVNGVPDAGIALPVTGAITRAFFLEGNRTLLVFVGDKAVLIDTRTNAIVLSKPFDLSKKVFLTPSPNGRFLAYYQAATLDKPTRTFAVFSLASGNTYLRTAKLTYWDLLTEEAKLFQFTPDSKNLIYLDDRNGPPTLYQVSVASLRKGQTMGGARLFAKGYTVAGFLIAPDGRIHYIANRDNPARWDLYAYDLVKKTLDPVMQNVSYATTPKTDGKRVYVNRLTEWGSEPVGYDPKTKALAVFPVPHPPATIAQGTQIKAGAASGVLVLPDNFDPQKQYPLVIWLHGGPYRHADIGTNSLASYGTYDWILENMRTSGAVILKLDYHGSYGYGRPFADSLRGNVGKSDVADVLAGLTAVKTKVKTGDTYLMGVSYGGYLAMRTIVEKPKLFAGAISVNGVMDWQRLVEQYPPTIFRTQFNGVPSSKNQALYNRASITDRADNLTTERVLLIHSENDTDVSYSQSVFMNALLTELGKNVQFVSYPGENHVFKYRATVEDVCRKTFAFTGLPGQDQCFLAAAGAGRDESLPQGDASSTTPL
jgi:dipeptidyl aminopeptidase/acylaminoacyl peptidase